MDSIALLPGEKLGVHGGRGGVKPVRGVSQIEAFPVSTGIGFGRKRVRRKEARIDPKKAEAAPP